MGTLEFRSKLDGYRTYVSVSHDKEIGYFRVQVDSCVLHLKTKDMKELIKFLQEQLSSSMRE